MPRSPAPDARPRPKASTTAKTALLPARPTTTERLTRPRRGAGPPHADAQPDANALALLARVAAAGSFAAAARELGQTRAAVSQRVAQIEAALGQPLFVRSTRALATTEAGRRLAARGRVVLDAVDAAQRGLRARAGAGLAGTLRITSAPLFAQAVLAPLLARWQAQHPALRVELHLTHRRVDLLREDVDLAFRVTRDPPPDTVATPVLDFEIGAYAAPSLLQGALRGRPPREPADLLPLPALLLGLRCEPTPLQWRRRGAGRAEADASQQQLLEPALAGDDMGTLLAVARAGGGVVYAPDFCVAEDLAAGRLVDLLPRWRLLIPEGQRVLALTLPVAVAPEAARAFVRVVAQACAQLHDH